VSHAAIEAVAGKGLVGDRHFDRYSKGQITVVSTDQLAKAEEKLGYSIPMGATRRNITVEGLELPDVVGARIRLGDVVVEVYRNASPCIGMEEAVGSGAQEALRGHSGIRGMIVEGGTISIGDTVELAT
jgi:MOSC domain-containing protein YiiM